MSFVGVDYSLSSPAYCISSSDDPTPDDCTFIVYADKKAHLKISHPQIKVIKKNEDLKEMARYIANSDMLFDFLHRDFIEGVFMEGYSFGSTSSSMMQIAENAGVFKHRLHQFEVPVTVFPPTTIKKFATGKGNATKHMMYDAWLKHDGWDLISIFKAVSPNTNPLSDLVDSYFILRKGISDLR